MFKDFWLVRLLSSEFGTSDIEARYTRVYIWLANQFGHATLGLLMVLVFSWLHETASQTTPAFRTENTFTWTDAMGMGVLLLVGSGLVVLHFRHWKTLDVSDQPSVGERESSTNLVASMGAGSRKAQAILGMGLAGLAIVLAGLSLMLNGTGAGLFVATPIVVVLFWSMTLAISRDLYVSVLASISMIAVWNVAQPGSVELALVCAGAFTAALLASSRSKDVGWSIILLGIVGAVLSVGLVACIEVTTMGWRVAIGGVIASVTFWLTKEFGSDIPLVADALAEASRDRQKGGQPAYPRLEKYYFTDAVADSRTDGAFYFLGALLGAGVSTQNPLIQASNWGSGAEIAALLICAVGFLFLSKRWLLRQQALDAINAPYTNRLAVLTTKLQLWSFDGPRRYRQIDEPLEALRRFPTSIDAGQIQSDKMDGDFDHLVVFGGPRSGKTPLGVALCCEAAIAQIPLSFTETLPRNDERQSAHFTTLSAFLADVHDRGLGNSVGSGDRTLIAIDDLRTEDVAAVGEVIGVKLPPSDLKTVWLVGCGPEVAQTIQRETVSASSVRAFTEKVSEALEDWALATGKGIRLGVAIVGD